MLIPKRVKYRRQHRPTRRGVSKGGNRVTFGDYGVQALEPAYIFPDRPLTQKPLGVRMGSGKGPVEKWIANVKPGRILFEMSYPSEEVALEALRRAGAKLPCKVRIVKKEDQF